LGLVDGKSFFLLGGLFNAACFSFLTDSFAPCEVKTDSSHSTESVLSFFVFARVLKLSLPLSLESGEELSLAESSFYVVRAQVRVDTTRFTPASDIAREML
jgi:hypothetical protein